MKATAIPFIFSCMDVFSTPPGRANNFSSLLKPRGFLISKWWILVLKSHILRLRITAKGNQHLTPHSSQLSQLISPKHSWIKYLREHLTNTVCFNRQTRYKLLLSCLWKTENFSILMAFLSAKDHLSLFTLIFSENKDLISAFSTILMLQKTSGQISSANPLLAIKKTIVRIY